MRHEIERISATF